MSPSEKATRRWDEERAQPSHNATDTLAKTPAMPSETYQQSFDSYRNYVGSEDRYDLIGAMQFDLMVRLGLREQHALLDIGCGSLRSGRLFIPYLLPGNYCGIEPNDWLIESGIQENLGRSIQAVKRPRFDHNDTFDLTVFGQPFDFLIAQSIFSHTSPVQTEACMRSARTIMTATSIFAATYFEGDESYTGDKWVYPGCVTYRKDDMRRMVEEAGLAFKYVDHFHPNGQQWFIAYDTAPLDGPTLHDDPGPFVGHLDDQAQTYPDVLTVWGWAAEANHAREGVDILILNEDGHLMARTTTNVRRDDVVGAFGQNAPTHAGWRASFGTALLNPGRHAFRAYAVDAAAENAYCLGVIKVKVTD